MVRLKMATRCGDVDGLGCGADLSIALKESYKGM